jgi:hypothetical protein
MKNGTTMKERTGKSFQERCVEASLEAKRLQQLKDSALGWGIVPWPNETVEEFESRFERVRDLLTELKNLGWSDSR